MAHTREDVANAKTAVVVALDRYIAIMKGNIAACENAKRSVMMVGATMPDVEVLTLHDTPEMVNAKTSFVRDLADKISNVTAPGNNQ